VLLGEDRDASRVGSVPGLRDPRWEPDARWTGHATSAAFRPEIRAALSNPGLPVRGEGEGRDKERDMRVVISEFTSLDGVVQAPGGAEEDTSGGFRHGGWTWRFFDPDVMGPIVDGFAASSDALIQGRTTYEASAAAWPDRTGVFADWINAAPKYVVSDILTDAEVTAWTPTTVIRPADLVDTVSDLRSRPGGDLYLYGSLTVARALFAAGLVDELVLYIEPITLGGGKTLFPTDGEAREWELTSVQRTGTGVLVCRYRPLAAS
jgi:dihydrofolate reductase